MSSKKSETPGLIRQALIGSVVVSMNLIVGLNVAWPVVLSVNDDEVPDSTSISITQQDLQWLVSVRSVLGIVAPLLAGVLVEALGPRRHLLFLLLPTISAWILMATFPSKIMLYGGRIILGITVAMVSTTIIILTTELLSPGIRGVAGAAQRVSSSVGMIIVYAMAAFLSWRVSTVFCGVIIVPLGILLLFVPESPYWLIKHGRNEKARQSLRKLRGPTSDIENEFQAIEKGFEDQPSVSITDQFLYMKTPRNYKPVILTNALVLLMMMSGEHAIGQYTVYLFKEADIDMDPYICSILVGTVLLASNIAVAFFIDRVGRRPLLIGSSLTCAVALSLSSLCMTYAFEPRWVTLVFVLVFVMGLGLGSGPIFNTMVGELLPTPVRSMGLSICVTTSFVGTFVASYSFPPMIFSVGLAPTFMVFAGFNIAVSFVTWMWVPETKGRTLADLQNNFASQDRIDSSQMTRITRSQITDEQGGSSIND